MKSILLSPARCLCAYVVLVFVGTVLVCADAKAAPPIDPVDYPDLRKHLLSGNANTQKAVFKRLLEQPRETHPTHYAGILGPLFTDPSTTADLDAEQRRTLFRVLIVHLADEQPGEDGAVLLVSTFLPHLAADPALLGALRAGKHFVPDLDTNRRPGWDRLVDAMIGAFGANSPDVRAAAMHAVAASAASGAERVRMPGIVAALYNARTAAAGTLQPSDDAAFLDALHVLLLHRFADTAEAEAQLQPFADRFARRSEWGLAESDSIGRQLLDLVLRLKTEKQTSGGEEHLQTAIKLGKALIEKASSPADLMRFFPADGGMAVELQRAAANKAAGMKPGREPGPDDPPGAWPEWALFHVAALSHSTDAEVLRDVIKLIAGTFSAPLGKTRATDVAAAAAKRLTERADSDAVEDRVKLATLIGSIGTIIQLRSALPSVAQMQSAKEQEAVNAALIGAVGLVNNGYVDLLVPYLEGDAERPEWLRVAVAKALGYTGFTLNPKEAPRAALLLRHILTGEAVEHTGEDGSTFAVAESKPAPSPRVRAEAIASLANYPGAEVARALETIARGDGPDAAGALRVLGRQLKIGSPDAATALANLLDSESVEARQTAILDYMAKGVTDDLDPAARAHLAKAIRALLAQAAAPEPVRLKAAAVAAKLRDMAAIPAVIRSWKPDPQKPDLVEAWRRPLETLVVAVAGARDVDDDKLAMQLAKVVEAGHNHADVLALYDAMGDHADRFALLRGRADLHWTYVSALRNSDVAAARKHLEAAVGLWKKLIGKLDADSPMRKPVYRDLFEAQQQRGQAPMLQEGENPYPFLKDAVYAATQSEHPEDLTVAQTNLIPKLETLELPKADADALVVLKEKVADLLKK